jgi:hypothetical protein
MAQMTALRRRLLDDMTVRNLSPATHPRPGRASGQFREPSYGGYLTE